MGTRRETFTLLAAVTGSAIVFLDATVVNVALPAIRRDLDTGFAEQQWVVEAYLLTLVSLLLIGGSLGDIYGRRRVFTIGVIGFGATSLGCALAPSDEALIAARAAQGLTGALLVPGSLAIISAEFKGEARGQAVGRWTAWTGIITVAGPAIGGALVDLASWRWIFWLNLPFAAATLWFLRAGVAESRDPEAERQVDYPGVVLSALGLGGTVFALISQPLHGWAAPQVVWPLVGGLAALAGFVLRELKAPAPMTPPALFKVRTFTVANLSTIAVYGGLYASTFFLSIFLQQTGGLSPLLAGLAQIPVTVMLFTLSGLFGRLSTRHGPRLFMGLGPAVAGIGLISLVRLERQVDYLTDALPGLILFGLGLAMTVAPLTAAVLNSVPEGRAGVASGINNAVSRIAGLFAIAAIGVWVASVYTSEIEQQLDRRALGPRAQQAIERASDRPLALLEFRNVPEPDRREVRQAVGEGSERAFHLAMLIAGLAAIIGGMIAAVGIRNADAQREGSRGE